MKPIFVGITILALVLAIIATILSSLAYSRQNSSLTLTGDVTGTGTNTLETKVITNADLTGIVTSDGNTTSIANGTITNTMLANASIANFSGSENVTNIQGVLNTTYPPTLTNPNLDSGVFYFSTTLNIISTTLGTGGDHLTYAYNNTHNEVITSGKVGANNSMYSTDLTTWTTITTPTNNAAMIWSPTLNYYGYIGKFLTDVYTTVDHIDYNIGTPTATANNGHLFWSTVFNKFIANNADTAHRIFDSLDGKVYVQRDSTRSVQDLAESKKLNIIVAVGDDGPQYSKDGETWINSIETFASDGIAWSDTYSVFVTVPRAGDPECWRSSDGINWTTTSPFNGAINIRSITWSQEMNLFVATGDNEYFAISMDGLTWQRLTILSGSVDFYKGLYIKEWGSFVFLSNTNNVAVNTKLFRSDI